jgi:hypothetical protein
VTPLATVLPEGLQFLKPGWWLLHVAGIALVFVWGYRRGRLAERRDRRASEARERKPEGGADR